ncbi:hypothetical protein H9L10_12840 [Phycicoccus endophyticus]|uniref:Uncharacterized protein n=1 Tax=Phycicoccus endophyticus TaxID=1690220 RepID=A0A7G9R0I2_9MICO|nr:hypothetical protein [Phycicoccus endophyticus]QNN49107.1 hypothetical protein H9L10_12840 [Phycicoccus endophyticus]
MTLRRRLVVAVAVLAVLSVLTGVVVVLVQRAFLVSRLDAELEALAGSPRAMMLASQRPGAAWRRPHSARSTSAGCRRAAS